MDVRAATPEDVSALAELLEEMDRFYGATEVDPLDRRLRQIAEALFGSSPAAQVIVAIEGERMVGCAAYSFVWPAVGLTRSLYLKELYVAESVRRRRVGRLLMQRLAEVALEHGCSRLEWTADQGNAMARSFYEDLGVEVNGGKLFYRVEGTDHIQSLAKGREG